jgi:hypothetical protein
MGKFLEAEKVKQTAFKRQSAYFSDEAQGDGIYRNKPRPFCISENHSEENLFHDIRNPAIAYFKALVT